MGCGWGDVLREDKIQILTTGTSPSNHSFCAREGWRAVQKVHMLCLRGERDKLFGKSCMCWMSVSSLYRSFIFACCCQEPYYMVNLKHRLMESNNSTFCVSVTIFSLPCFTFYIHTNLISISLSSLLSLNPTTVLQFSKLPNSETWRAGLFFPLLFWV